MEDVFQALIPEDWLRKAFEKELDPEELKKIKSLGGLEKLLEEFKKRLEEQKERHEGGNKWVGTNGTSPYGHGGQNPEGIRIGGPGGQKKAVKIWEQRQYSNLDDSVIIGTRDIKMALRRLRKFARQGNDLELDMDDTIKSTAKNADSSKAIPPLYGALLKNEQDVQLLERLAFMSRRESNSK